MEYNFRGQVVQRFAKKEVIVSAGTINTPKLLQLSGIGPKETLQSHNVAVVKVDIYAKSSTIARTSTTTTTCQY